MRCLYASLFQYLSSNLSQNGDDDEGFLGFLEADIRKEELRVSHLVRQYRSNLAQTTEQYRRMLILFQKCFYCNKKYANIGCCEKKCRHTFHLVCGIENGAENQFCKSFQSYCRRHRRKNYSEPPPNTTCLICYENLREESERKKFDPVNMIQTPCCRNGFFHKLCLQKFAKTAGYFFKCPLCNDSKVFRQKLPAKGIFIPNQWVNYITF